MNNSPLVSIIIPTYKRPATLDRAINSVLNQTYDNIEIIIVDDNGKGSRFQKKTEKQMKKYDQNEKIKYIKHKVNKNGAAARNTGIEDANGDYIAFLDDDDEFLSKKIELQVNKLEILDEEWGGVYSGFIKKFRGNIISQSDKLEEGALKKELLMDKFHIGSGSNLFFRRNVVKTLDGFDENFERHQDLEILVRFFRKYKLAKLQEKLLIVNDYENFNLEGDDMLKLKKKYLKKFRSDIQTFSKKTQKKIYKKHILKISNAYLNEGNFQKGYFYYNKAKHYAEPNFKEKVYFSMNLIHSFTSLKEKIGKIKRKILI